MTKDEARGVLDAARAGADVAWKTIRNALYATGDLASTWTLETVRARCDEEGDCWLWAHSLNGNGYPQAYINGERGASVRRFVFRLVNGAGRSNHLIRLSCGNRSCVSPIHLQQMSRGDALKASYAAGERNTIEVYAGRRRAALKRDHVILNQDKADEIRVADGTCHSIAKEFGVSKTTVAAIRRGLFWRRESSGASVFSWRP